MDHQWSNENTIAVVTGGNKGIGLETVRQLARHGLTVVLTARDQSSGLEACNSLVDEGLQSVVFHELDVGSPDSITKFAAWVKQKFGVVDILINNAAVSGVTVDLEALEANHLKVADLLTDASAGKKCFTYNIESARICINTNYYGAKRTIEALLPLFRASPAGARIVNVSSILGQLQNLPNESLRQQFMHPETLTEDFIEGVLAKFLEDLEDGKLDGRGWPEIVPAYSMSKVGMNAYTRLLARNLESRPEGQKIYANIVHPGYVRTDMTFQTEELSASEGEKGVVWISASEAAEGVVWLALLPPGGPSGEFFAFKKPFQF